MRTPLLVVTGIHPDAMDLAMMGLAWDLPDAVAVRHRFDPEAATLTRTVSHAQGILEHEVIDLAHACVTCALREDILPTLERLARDPRRQHIVACLPTATEADQLAYALTRDRRLARLLKLSGVVCAMAGGTVAADLLSSDHLHERGVHARADDERGVGEVACAQVEFADVVVLDGAPTPPAGDLVRALARPGVRVCTDPAGVDAVALAGERHRYALTHAWASPEIDQPTAWESPHVWRLDLTSPYAFHPERLLDRIESLGAGTHRSRGRFWLPTRPGELLEWSGAGGQLSIGGYCPWGARTPDTRLVLTGLGEAPQRLEAAFEDLLLTPAEARLGHHHWSVVEDGLEPWLGEIRDAA